MKRLSDWERQVNELEMEIAKLRDIIDDQHELLNAVKCTELNGIVCSDVAGRNWFDIRDSYTTKGLGST